MGLITMDQVDLSTVEPANEYPQRMKGQQFLAELVRRSGVKAVSHARGVGE